MCSVFLLAVSAALASSAELFAADRSRWCCRFAAPCCTHEQAQVGSDAAAPRRQLLSTRPRRRSQEAAAEADDIGELKEDGEETEIAKEEEGGEEEEEEGGEQEVEEGGGEEEEEEHHIKEWWEPAYAEYTMDPVAPFQYLSLLLAAIVVISVLACIVRCAPKSSLLYRSMTIQL